MLDSSAVDAPTMLGTRTIVIEIGVRWISHELRETQLM